MLNTNFQNTEKLLQNSAKQANSFVKVDIKHHYMLRRSLLNCDVFHESSFKRTICRLKMYKTEISKVTGVAVSVGVIVFVIVMMPTLSFVTTKAVSSNLAVDIDKYPISSMTLLANNTAMQSFDIRPYSMDLVLVR